jgi:DNA-binding NtrC family response regulator
MRLAPRDAVEAASMSASTLTIFHLDDDPLELRQVERALVGEGGFALTSLASLDELERALAARPRVDAFLVDVHVGADDGLALLPRLRAAAPDAAVVMYSQDLRQLQRAVDLGADDFVYKAKGAAEVPVRLRAAVRLRARAAASPTPVAGAVGATMARIAQRMPALVGSAVRAVHVTGPTGAGKEVVVDLLAACLPRGMPLVRVNCGAIAAELVESTLFGHAKGAFTGAVADRRGLFEAASGGFIFLDEVASLPRAAQAALLRALDNNEILRVGESAPRRVDVRVVSATLEPLPRLVASGAFRNDLWQRLRETEIALPSLAERTGELDALIDHFCRVERGGPYAITPEARDLLKARDWSAGNVRALRNVIRAMTERQVDGLLTPRSVPAAPGAAPPAATGAGPAPGELRLVLDVAAADPPALEDLEDRALVALVRALRGVRPRSVRETAKLLKTPPTTLTRRLRQAVDKGLMERDELPTGRAERSA